MVKSILPQPDEQALAHSATLFQLIAHEIQRQGSLSFKDYMALTLYSPGLGYYSAGSRKLGAAGDFVTAPEISPLFSYCLARQCQQVLSLMPQADILEMGAGSGVMAADLLAELERQGSLPTYYFILEVSADLRERQRQLLQNKIPHLLSRVIWLQQLPEKMKGIILANEVLDAMPVAKFKIERGVKEFFVTLHANKLDWQVGTPNDAVISAVEKLGPLAEGYESEINLWLPPWLQSLANSLQQGVMLLIDYGFPRHEYYHPDRKHGTLMCHYRHHAHTDPFFLPGLQDITAHVDFTAVAEAAEAAKLTVAGYTTQAYFLLGCQIIMFAERRSGTIEQFDLAQQIKKLTLPSEMGELFKVMALTKNFTHSLMGFEFRDLREKL